MNEQLPQIDAGLRGQLARRSDGRVPEGLLEEVEAGLDSVSTVRPVVTFSLARPSARTSGALVGLVVVAALLAALVAVPGRQGGPAASGSYPADRPLTSAELAALLAGPTLPINTALVADVTIQARTDVCPMDRYPTIGVVEGMRSQVCVMGAGYDWSVPPGGGHSGTFAFRYLAPGYLGLLGEVRSAASRLAFAAQDDWPVGTSVFVVEGWLGAVELLASCAYAPTAGDVLSPNGEDCPYEDWLGSESTAPTLARDYTSYGGVSASYDPLSLRGNARHVQAGGMRIIDGLDGDLNAAQAVTPVHGFFVVREAAGACPSASPADSRSCPYWLAVAKLADITPPSTATPTPAATRASYPIDRALTADELGRLVDAGSLQQYDTVVVDADVAAAPAGACAAFDPTQLAGIAKVAVGVIGSLEPPICVYAAGGRPIEAGHLALRVLGSRQLGYMGTVGGSSHGLAYGATDVWPEGYFLVQGWLDTNAGDCGSAAGAPGIGGPDPLFPVYSEMCHAALSVTRFDSTRATYSGPTPAGPPRIEYFPVPEDGQGVDPAPYFEFPSDQPTTGSVEGTYLLYRSPHCSEFGNDCEDFYVFARLADVSLPRPTPEPVATPVPAPSATMATTSGYPATRALSADELEGELESGLPKDQVVVAHVSIDETKACAGLPGYRLIGTLTGVSREICVVGTEGSSLFPAPATGSGTLAFRVLDSNTIGYLATVSAAGPNALAFAPDQTWPTGESILVSGYLVSDSGVYRCPMIPASTPDPLGPKAFTCGRYWLAPSKPSAVPAGDATAPPGSQQVWLPDYPAAGGDLIPTTLVADFATYLLWWTCPSDCGWQVVARVDPVSLPAVLEPSPSASPTSQPTTTSGAVGLWGQGDRPLTVDELRVLWTADSTHLAGQTVIAKGPVYGNMACVPPMACLNWSIAPEGYWVVQFDAQGKPSIVGELSTPNSRFSVTIEQLQSARPNDGDLLVVDASLAFDGLRCDVISPSPYNPPCSSSWLQDDAHMYEVLVQPDAYGTFASGVNMAPVPGRYLVRWSAGGNSTVLARMETAGP